MTGTLMYSRPIVVYSTSHPFAHARMCVCVCVACVCVSVCVVVGMIQSSKPNALSPACTTRGHSVPYLRLSSLHLAISSGVSKNSSLGTVCI